MDVLSIVTGQPVTELEPIPPYTKTTSGTYAVSQELSGMPDSDTSAQADARLYGRLVTSPIFAEYMSKVRAQRQQNS